MDSDEYHIDEGKRKKDEELFKRTRRTSRTPIKGKESKDQMKKQMGELMSLMKNLVQNKKDIKIDQRNSNEKTKKLQKEIRCLRKEQREFKDDINELKETNGKAKKEIEDLEKEVEKENERMEKIEGEKRNEYWDPIVACVVRSLLLVVEIMLPSLEFDLDNKNNENFILGLRSSCAFSLVVITLHSCNLNWIHYNPIEINTDISYLIAKRSHTASEDTMALL
ncbi:hypothetical protein FQA39_LY19222 [Lamprigera yunnana]|nr:hypothetical protein FQA39_LY19222 [Lamprigera yunnana]